MSNRKIDNLFYENLIEGLTGADGKLEIMVMKPDVILSDEQLRLYDNVSQIIPSLIPAPSETQTLGGDHKRFTGIYQLDVKIFMDAEDEESNFSNKLYDIQEKIQDLFSVDAELVLGDFSVQVISPLKTTAGKQFKQWWTCHCYFNYRADTN